ncbi:MAG: hypothetical protein M3040_10475 [Bacteroidota bacterium]|nr:hypothetical protein [Bacteroidota bacterium]
MEFTFPPVSHAVIAGCINKDRDSQKKLYDLLSPLIFAEVICAGFCRQQSEELAARVFVAIFNSIDQYDCSSSFHSWALGIHEGVISFYCENSEHRTNG